jgi:hypothetical protein
LLHLRWAFRELISHLAPAVRLPTVMKGRAGKCSLHARQVTLELGRLGSPRPLQPRLTAPALAPHPCLQLSHALAWEYQRATRGAPCPAALTLSLSAPASCTGRHFQHLDYVLRRCMCQGHFPWRKHQAWAARSTASSSTHCALLPSNTLLTYQIRRGSCMTKYGTPHQPGAGAVTAAAAPASLSACCQHHRPLQTRGRSGQPSALANGTP